MSDEDAGLWSALVPEIQPEIAKQYAAAFISYQLGISFSAAMKRYVDGKPVGKLWMTLAAITTDAMQNARPTE